MKLLNLLLVILLLQLFSCEEYCNEDTNPSKAKDCNNLKIDPSDEDGKYCCFVENGNEKFCEVYSQEEYDKIEDLIKQVEKAGGKDVSIDCASNYTMISLLSLILLLL